MTNKPGAEATPPSFTFLVFLGASLFVFIQSFRLLSPILLSFLLVMLIAMAANPIMSRMRRLPGGRKSATGLMVGMLVMVVALTGWAFFGPMKDSMARLSEQLPSYWERLQKPLIKMEQKAELSEKRLQAEVTTEISQTASNQDNYKTVPQIEQVEEPEEKEAKEEKKETGSIRSSLSDIFLGVAGRFARVAFNGAQILVVLVTVFFGTTFTLMNPRPIFRAMFALMPEHTHEQTLIIVQRVGNFMPRWAGATLLGMLTVGLLVFLLMWPIFGLMDALVLGLIAFILEAIPFLGPILSAVPAILLALGQGGMTPLWVVLAYIAVQAVEGNVITPFIMARGMKIHPLAMIFSMLLCVAAFGVLGVLVAAPLVAIVNICHQELYRKRYLPSATDTDLDALAKKALLED
ncbi:MAG: AI-2E family transporter [Desulfuromonadales bacterium]|nr:AI-2E family transporter [Desulfuromonadales bacterium]